MTKLKENNKNVQSIQMKAPGETEKKKDGGDKWKLNYKMIDLNLNMTIISFKHQWNKH